MTETERRLTPQPAIGNMPERISFFRSQILDVASVIEQITGKSREQSLALTHLEEVLMWTNKAIVLGDAVIEP
jgi:hypothetical protein